MDEKSLSKRFKSMLENVQITIHVLSEMLESYDCKNGDEDWTMRELYKICKKHKPLFDQLTQLCPEADTQINTETQGTYRKLLAVMQNYKKIVKLPAKTLNPQDTPADKAALTVSGSDTYSNMQDDLLTPTVNDIKTLQTDESTGTIDVATSSNDVDELHKLFEITFKKKEENKDYSQKKYSIDKYHDLRLFQQRCENMTVPDVDSSSDIQANGLPVPMNQKTETSNLPEIDKLLINIFLNTLTAKELSDSLKDIRLNKVSLNDLNNTYMNDEISDEPHSINSLVKDDTDSKPNEMKPLQNNSLSELTLTPKKYLTDIKIDLDMITPSGEQRVVMDDDDIKLSLYFCLDRPSKQVSVIVITAENKSKHTIKEFKLEGSVKKPCKIHLLQPTSNTLELRKTFRSADSINQIMLLHNPTGSDVDIVCIVGYQIGDDSDPIKESVVIKGISFVD